MVQQRNRIDRNKQCAPRYLLRGTSSITSSPFAPNDLWLLLLLILALLLLLLHASIGDRSPCSNIIIKIMLLHRLPPGVGLHLPARGLAMVPITSHRKPYRIR
uniref:Uncharacterized protein n=1 Tax=Anopheles farauti TaxID=69004 RepID=A0A182QFY5_9DIPT